MEKLYEVTLGKFRLIDKKRDLYQYMRKDIDEKPICIADGDKFVNIKNSEEYKILRQTESCIVIHEKVLKEIVCVVKSKPYEKDNLSDNEVSINYLRAIRTRRMLNNKTILEQHDKTYQKRR